MFGQFLVEPEPVPAPVPDPELPVLELDGDGVVVDEFEVEVELVPVLPVVVDVVAALAASAPPARRPDVSAPMASTLRRRICMVCALSSVWSAGSFGPVLQRVRLGSERRRTTTWAGAKSCPTNA
jgi:hypothetical protein